ncbi:MAG: Na/Pi cotransporter family protein [Desulfobulbus sp.]
MFAMFDGWKFLAGLGIFLFGMFMMEESVKLLAGRSFKILIRRCTENRLKGLLTGFVTTAILQSSSAVSLMVLAFVGAGLMSLANAVAVLMGAMVGTTCTAWVVALVGFQLKIDVFALPLIGIGGLGLIFFSGSTRYINISKLLVAFGFLFHGLDFMKTSVETFAGSVDLSTLPNLGLWVYVLIGIILTAAMQSSSATIAIILTALFSGIIDFREGAALVIGANVGTTVTVLLGAIGGIPAKKQTAVSSLIFNAVTALIVSPLLPLMTWITQDFFHLADNPVLGIALFHTLFNVLGVLLFFPFISGLVHLLHRFFPEKRTVLTLFIHNTSPQVPEAALAALRNEVLHQLLLSVRYIGRHYGLKPPEVNQTEEDIGSADQKQSAFPLAYGDLEHLHAEIFTFYAQIQAETIDPQEAVLLEPIIRSSRSMMNVVRNLYDLRTEIDDIGGEDNAFLLQAHAEVLRRLSLLWKTIEQVATEPRPEVQEEELRLMFQNVEKADKAFIRASAGSISRREIREQDVTKLLMINRFLTQSSRMVVLSMQNLVPLATPNPAPAQPQEATT